MGEAPPAAPAHGRTLARHYFANRPRVAQCAKAVMKCQIFYLLIQHNRKISSFLVDRHAPCI